MIHPDQSDEQSIRQIVSQRKEFFHLFEQVFEELLQEIAYNRKRVVSSEAETFNYTEDWDRVTDFQAGGLVSLAVALRASQNPAILPELVVSMTQLLLDMRATRPGELKQTAPSSNSLQ